jgi:hypothetical protein
MGRTMLEIKDIIQIILIPILTILLSGVLDLYKEKRKRNLKKDQDLFESLKVLFEGERNLVIFFRDHSVGDLTHRDYISRIVKIENDINLPGFVFSNRKLEKLRKDLHSKVKEFLSHTSTHFLPHKKQSDYYDITYRYEAKKGTDHEASRKFKELYTMIDNIGTEIYNLYREMATIAQRNI